MHPRCGPLYPYRARQRVGRVVVLRPLGVVHDLLPVGVALRRRFFQPLQPAPDPSRVRRYLHELVLLLLICCDRHAHLAESLGEISLVGVALHVDGSQAQPLVHGRYPLCHLVDVRLRPQASVHIRHVPAPPDARDRRAVSAAVCRVHVHDAIGQHPRIGEGSRLAVEYRALLGHVAQLVVSRIQAPRHALLEVGGFLVGYEARGPHRPPPRLGHEGEGVLRVPRRACVDYAPAPVPDVLKLSVCPLGRLALGPRHAVAQRHDVVCVDAVVVLAGQASADSVA